MRPPPVASNPRVSRQRASGIDPARLLPIGRRRLATALPVHFRTIARADEFSDLTTLGTRRQPPRGRRHGLRDRKESARAGSIVARSRLSHPFNDRCFLGFVPGLSVRAVRRHKSSGRSPDGSEWEQDQPWWGRLLYVPRHKLREIPL